MNDPDSVVRRLWRLRERLSSPLSSVPYEVTGGVWSTTCASCGHMRHHRREGVERCSKCGDVWPEIESRVAKGSAKHRPRVNAMERSYLELARCVSILNHVPEPARSLYEFHLDPRGGGLAWSVAQARQAGLCDAISPHAYWASLRMAREVVGLRLALIGGVTMTRGAA